MKWSPQQDAALQAVDKWLKESEEQVFRLFGYAGTGKTTLAKHLAASIARVRFAAFTGKAAHVLQQKGCSNATTIHSLIYLPKGKSGERLRQLQEKAIGLDRDDPTLLKILKLISEEETNLKAPSFTLNLDSPLLRTDLLIIDECSMVDDRMAEDLLHFGCKVLVLGDPAQLPPVRGTGYFTERKPDILLTEIHRQAADSPIIKLATDIRTGGVLKLGTYGESAVVDQMTPEMALEADQILVGTNKTRNKVNRRVRELLGHTGIAPNVGERLVCLRNNHELGLLNGSMWVVKEIYDDDDPIAMAVTPEDGKWSQDVMVHRGHFDNTEIEWHSKRDAEEFCAGYALTVHKSQGSQWDNVMLIDESWMFRQHPRKHLYTAITRAAEKVIIKI